MKNYIKFDEEDAFKKLSEDILMKTNEKNAIEDNKEIVIICIGTDRSTTDSFGPFVGEMLKENHIKNVHGDLKNPIHSKNYQDKIKEILKNYENPFVIVVIPAIGENHGSITINSEPVVVGAGVGKDLGSVGDVSVCGIVSQNDYGLIGLTTSRMHIIYNMAKVTSKAIINSLEYLKVYNIYNKIIEV